ncbi:MAG: class I SAM-dependent methyltransferase [Deltaproteobacteria bacterium]
MDPTTTDGLTPAQRAIKRFLGQILRPESDSRTAAAEYAEAFSSEGEKKVDFVIEYFAQEEAGARLNLESYVALSVGGADGSDLLGLARSTPLKNAVLLEVDDLAAERARQVTAAEIKELDGQLRVIQGDAHQRLEDVVTVLEDQKSAGYTGLVCLFLGVLHELPRRSPNFELHHFLSRLTSVFDNQILFLSEPCAPTQGDEACELSIASVSEDDLYDAAVFIRDKVVRSNSDVRKLKNGKIQCSRTVAVETLHKLIRDDPIARSRYEVGERLTSFSEEDFVSALWRTLTKPQISVTPRISRGFRRQLSAWDVVLAKSKTSTPPFGEHYQMPHTHTRIIAESLHGTAAADDSAGDRPLELSSTGAPGARDSVGRWLVGDIGSGDPLGEHILQYRRLTFLGVSQRSLPIHLRRILERCVRSNRTAKWEEIDVILASESDGGYWHADFADRAEKARQELARTLTHQDFRRAVPQLTEVRFFQASHRVNFGGCILERDETSAILYLVNYLPAVSPVERGALMYELQVDEASHPNAKLVLEEFRRSYDRVIQQARLLGGFSPSAWDDSAKDWGEFCASSEAHRASADKLLEVAGDGPSWNRILDLAGGTGHIAARVRERFPTAHITVLDSSPQMLMAARRELSGPAEFMLASIPVTAEMFGTASQSQFDFAYCHLVMPEALQNQEQLRQFGIWISRRIRTGGCFVLCAHHAAIDAGETHRKERDPVKDALHKVLQSKFHHLAPLVRSEERQKLTPTQVVEALANSETGLVLAHQELSVRFQVQPDERLKMWRTAAILNSYLDVSAIDSDERHRLTAEVSRRAKGRMRDMVTFYWKFEPSRGQGPSG